MNLPYNILLCANRNLIAPLDPYPSMPLRMKGARQDIARHRQPCVFLVQCVAEQGKNIRAKRLAIDLSQLFDKPGDELIS